MSKYWRYTKFCWVLALSAPVMVAQQIEPKQEINIDDLGNVSDAFQESFFEALKQKAITNHEKAIEALEECIAIDDEPLYLYEELAKNYLALKKYELAEENFKKVLAAKPEDRYSLELLFEAYFKQQKFTESVSVVERLTTFDVVYKEQLANLYFIERRYDEALIVVDELIEELGLDSYRKQLRKKIMLKISNPNSQIARLTQKIEEQPEEEQHYLNLIYLYSQSNQQQEAYAVAEKLLKKKPKSELVHLALYKFYLDDHKIEKAIRSMKIALGAPGLDADAKYKMVNDFLEFVERNPSYESELTTITKTLSEDKEDSKVFTDIGNYFYKRDQKELALNFYERGIKSNAANFDTLKKILLLQLDLKRFEKAKVGSELAIEMYPSQPLLYLVSGVALLNLEENEQAVEVLTTGMDFIIEDDKMESDFYEQIANAYTKIGDAVKAGKYKAKAVELKKKSQ